MNPTKEQLADPKWWAENAPEGATHFTPKRNESGIWNAVFWRIEGQRCYESWPVDDNWGLQNFNSLPGPMEPKKLISRPIAWSGEGLPPVGTVCEVDYCEEWRQCEVIAQFQQRCGMVAAFTVEGFDGAKSLDAFGAEDFRPIRTPEQIEEEDREKAIDAILDDLSLSPECRYIAKRVHDAGYRKQEQK